jgi:propanediol utilization protein
VFHTLWSRYHQKDVRARLKLADSGRIFTPKQEVEVYNYRSQLGAQTKLEAIDLLNDATVLKHFRLFGDIRKVEARVRVETAAFS